MRRSTVLLITLGIVANGCGADAPTDPSVLIVVDTNLPAPMAITQVRFDVYSDEGTWFDARTVDVGTTGAWPLTFRVAGKAAETTSLVVRARAYLAENTRPYTGHRFQEWPDNVTTTASGNDQPRLIQDGVDITPTVEPLPSLTVDRLVRVSIGPGDQGRVSLFMDGLCVGRMAELGPKWTSCHSESEPRIKEEVATIEADTTPIAPSHVGMIGQTPCPPARDRAPCIVGGAFVFGPDGSIAASTTGLIKPLKRPSALEVDGDANMARLAVVPSFRMSETEITVRQMRKALGEGLVLEDTLESGSIGIKRDDIGLESERDCTFTTEPGSYEGFAVSCVSWESARAYCNHDGGDLPTEAEWEYAASASGRDEKTIYPWGNDEPKCDGAVFARKKSPLSSGFWCGEGDGVGPLSVATTSADGKALATRDTTPVGILHLGGNLAEWTRDAALSWLDACWLSSLTAAVSCAPEKDARVSARGGSWASSSAAFLRSDRRQFDWQRTRSTRIGFRCVYR